MGNPRLQGRTCRRCRASAAPRCRQSRSASRSCTPARSAARRPRAPRCHSAARCARTLVLAPPHIYEFGNAACPHDINGRSPCKPLFQMDMFSHILATLQQLQHLWPPARQAWSFTHACSRACARPPKAGQRQRTWGTSASWRCPPHTTPAGCARTLLAARPPLPAAAAPAAPVGLGFFIKTLH